VVPKGRYLVYLRRSDEFERQMTRAVDDRAWNSVGLLGVHTVISACDALTVHLTGQRWSGQDHAGTVGMVGALHVTNADRALRQVSRVLAAKNRVEYEAREFSKTEAEEVCQSVGRVKTWIKAQLPT
jgi:hypothetical protein